MRWRERSVAEARLLFDQIGSAIDPETYVRELSMPEQQMVEIVCALGAEAKIVIMDEPTASLGSREVKALFVAIDRLHERGAGVVYISHRLEELPGLADRVTVLRDGRVVETREMCDVDTSALIRMMVGRELTTVFSKACRADRRDCTRDPQPGIAYGGNSRCESQGACGRDSGRGRLGRIGPHRTRPHTVRTDPRGRRRDSHSRKGYPDPLTAAGDRARYRLCARRSSALWCHTSHVDRRKHVASQPEIRVSGAACWTLRASVKWLPDLHRG